MLYQAMKRCNDKLAKYQQSYLELCCGMRQPTNNNMLDKFYVQMGSKIKSPLLSLNMVSYFDRELCFRYIQAVHKLLVQDTGRTSTDEIKDNQSEMLSLGVALSDFFFAYNTKSTDTEFALYTSSLSVLKNLNRMGLLLLSRGVGTQGLAGFYDNFLLDGVRDEKGNFVHPCTGMMNFVTQHKAKKKVSMKVIRLDPVSYNGTIKFKPVEANGFTLDEMIIYPYSCIQSVYKYLQDMTNKSILEITEVGNKVYVTRNAEILAGIYGIERAQLLRNRSINHLGVLTKECYMPEIGKSVASYGLHNIKLENLDQIRVLRSIAETGLGEKLKQVKLDTTDLPYFLRNTPLLTGNLLDILLQKYGEYNKSDWNISEIKNTDIEHYNNIKRLVLVHGFYNILWECISKEPKLEPLKQGYEKYINEKQRKYEPVEKDKWNYQDLMSLSNVALLKIVSKRVAGTTKANMTVKLRTSIVTNNQHILERYLGADYRQKYESVGVQLQYINYMMSQNMIKTDEELRQAIVDYNLTDRINIDTLTIGNAGVVLGDVYKKVQKYNKGQGMDNFTARSPFGLTVKQGAKYNTYNVNIPIKEIEEVYIIREKH